MLQGLFRAGMLGSGMIVAVLGCRALLAKRMPGRLFPLLWGLAAVRLLLPVALASPVSVYALAPMTAEGGMGGALPAGQGTGGFPWGIVWIAGTLGMALVFGLRFWRSRRLFAQALSAEGKEVEKWLEGHPMRRGLRVKVSDRVDTPLTYGVLRPVILLPAWMRWEDGLPYALLHEYVHARWADAGFLVLTAAALCVHWWNPLVWVLYRLAEADLELACDREVVRRCGEDHRGDYARVLLGLEERRQALGGAVPMKARDAQKRIGAILRYRKTGIAAGIVGTALALAVVVTLGAAPFRSPLDKLEASVVCREGQVIFTLPEGEWQVFVSGRLDAGGHGDERALSGGDGLGGGAELCLSPGGAVYGAHPHGLPERAGKGGGFAAPIARGI